MKTNQALEAVRQGLSRLGFRETTPDHWESPAAGARLTVTRLEFGNPYYRCEWTAGQFQDVMFFDFGLGNLEDANGLNSLLAWAGWYAAGNRMSREQTIGYATAEAVAA